MRFRRRYATKANYKNVIVTVSRARDSKLMAQQSTQVGPRQRACLGGINKGTVIVQVQRLLEPEGAASGRRRQPDQRTELPSRRHDRCRRDGEVPGARSGERLDLLRPRGSDLQRLHPAAGCRGDALPARRRRNADETDPGVQARHADLPAAERRRHPVQQCGGLHRDRARGLEELHLQRVAGSPVTITSITNSAGVSIPLPSRDATRSPSRSRGMFYADPVVQDVP